MAFFLLGGLKTFFTKVEVCIAVLCPVDADITDHTTKQCLSFFLMHLMLSVTKQKPSFIHSKAYVILYMLDIITYYNVIKMLQLLKEKLPDSTLDFKTELYESYRSAT